MKDVMLDLETFGTRHDALIVQIGACYFDRMTGEIGDTFSMNVSESILDKRFTIDYSTLKWWMEQSEEARRSLFSDPHSIMYVLNELNRFLGSTDGQKNDDILIWSHATFDIPILMHAYNVCETKYPIPYRNTRDLRTLMDLYGRKVELSREGTHHNALDDAKYQAQYASIALRNLKSSEIKVVEKCMESEADFVLNQNAVVGDYLRIHAESR